ncbi:MAG: glycosyltransferase family 4 protein [Ignavibacteria bacterium]|nr:glycosyltransferase family 4 protein [Ignavibacteria bacterium]
MPITTCHILFNTVHKLPPLYNELVQLSARGEAATVYEVTNHDEQSAPPPDLPGVTFHRVSLGLRRVTTRQSRVAKLLRFVEYVFRAFIFAVKQDCDILVAHDLPAVLPAYVAARLRRRPVVYNAHELWSETNGMSAPFPALWARVDRFFCPRVDAMIAPEPNRARIYMEEYGAPALPVVAANCPLFTPLPATTLLRDSLAQQGFTPEIIVLYQGIFDPSRRLHHLIAAMELLPATVALVIMGRGSAEQQDALEALRQSLGLQRRVFFHPFVPYDRLAAYTRSADIGVLLYTNDCRNNFYCAPNKLYEYLHAGLPVVTSAFPGLEAVVDGFQLGICVDPESPADIAQGLSRLLDEDTRKLISNRAIRISREIFNWEVEFERILKLYFSLIPR